MRTVQRTIYYCDHCGRHKHRRSSMQLHERHCTMNPARTCRWSIGDEAHPEFVLTQVAAELYARAQDAPQGRRRLDAADIDWLRSTVGGCPACMLASLRQSGIRDWHFGRDFTTIFSYESEVERWKTDEREYWVSEERREIERSFL